MPLTLTIRNVASLENGSPLAIVLDRRGAGIGRTPTADWCLPDPSRYISSNHCEIRFAGEHYEIIDQSTNGTFLLGQAVRLPVPHVIRPGDVFVIGRFEVEAALDDTAAAAAALRNAAPVAPEWQGWASGTAGADIAPQANSAGWGAPPPGSAMSGSGPMSQAWAPPVAPAPSPWDLTEPEQVTLASDWSSPPAPPTAPGAADIWDRFAAMNVVDWSRSGFGAPPPMPAFGDAAPVAPAAAQAAQRPNQEQAARAPATPPAPALLAGLLGAAQVDPAAVRQDEGETARVAGDLLRRLVAGLFVLMEARARAKSQMGAQGTSFSVDGNNPLKFSRTPEQALLALLNPPERGFQPADRAVEDAFKDLQAHQMATLRAMQGALRATLDRFSPSAIRARAKDKGLLAKILPGARDAALWSAYEREFGGVVQGSDEAFMDMFAKEFRRAYEEISAQR